MQIGGEDGIKSADLKFLNKFKKIFGAEKRCPLEVNCEVPHHVGGCPVHRVRIECQLRLFLIHFGIQQVPEKFIKEYLKSRFNKSASYVRIG